MPRRSPLFNLSMKSSASSDDASRRTSSVIRTSLSSSFGARRKSRSVHLPAMIRKEKWDELRNHLGTPEGQADAIARESNKDFADQNLLHEIASRRPPADLVETLAKLCPSLAKEKDLMGRMPLHTAASCGASVDVVSALLSAHKGAAGVQDENGMTPMALAAMENDLEEDNLKRAFDGNGEDAFIEERLGVYRALILACPKALLCPDSEGMIPVERATAEGARPKLVTSLVNATRRVQKTGIKRAAAASFSPSANEKCSVFGSVVSVPSQVDVFSCFDDSVSSEVSISSEIQSSA